MSKREILNNVAAVTGVTTALRISKSFSNSYLPILAYHRILNCDENNFNHDIELVSSSIESFEKQISYISKFYTPITFKDIADKEYITSLNKPPVIITFDDGFYDNYQYAFPILKKYKTPATFFIVTEVIDKNIPLWFDLLAYLLIESKQEFIIFNDKKYYLEPGITLRRKLVSELLLDLRQVTNEKRINIIDSLKLQIPLVKYYDETMNYVNWDNLSEMNDNGMEIGSHSVSHPILAQTTHDTINFEINHSKLRIEEELNTSCEVFAYPVGGFEEYNQFSKLAIKDANYKYACSYEPGINKLPFNDPFQLRRIHIERYTSFNSFKNLLISSFFGYK